MTTEARQPSGFGEPFGCALMILAAGIALAVLRWAAVGFPAFWK